MSKQGRKENERDAVVFVPGLGRRFVPQDLDTIGAKIAGSLERNSEHVHTAYVVSSGVEEVYADDHRTQVRQLMAKVDEKEQVVADLYELDYHDNLRKSFEDRSLLGKCLTVLATLIATTPAYLRAIASPGKNRAEKAQIFLAGGILGIVAFYFLLLLVTLLGTVMSLGDMGVQGPRPEVQTAAPGVPAAPAQETVSVLPGSGSPALKPAVNANAQAGEKAVDGQNEPKNANGGGTADREAKVTPPVPNPAPPEPAASDESPAALGWQTLEKWFPWLQTLVVVVAGLGALSKQSLKLLISEAATEYVTAVAYIQAAERKQSVNGQLTALIEYVLERTPTYRRVHLVGFSFGSLIALDTLFPRHPPSLHLRRVDTLVTIGCPFDMVRTFWPQYFEQRKIAGSSGPKWMNIYSRYDVLGSNFRDDSNEDVAEGKITARAFGMSDTPEQALKPENVAYDLGIEIGRIPLLTILTLKGFKAHGLYWEGSGTSELSCFDLAMPQLLFAGKGKDAGSVSQ